MEAVVEDPVGRGDEGDGQVEGPVEGAGPTGRWEVQPGGAGLCDKISYRGRSLE